MITYYAKFQVEYKTGKNPFYIAATRLAGENSNNARQNAEKLLSERKYVKSFEILKISEYPIIIREFQIKGNKKYSGGRTSPFNYIVKGEDKIDAENIFKLVSKNWEMVVSIEITEISIFKKSE